MGTSRKLKKTFSKRSFTLIETIIVLAIMSTFLPLLISLFFVIVQSQYRVYMIKQIQLQGSQALSTMRKTIATQAKDVGTTLLDCPLKSLYPIPTPQTTIKLTTKNGEFSYFAENNMIASSSAVYGVTNKLYLTDENVSITDLYFTCTRSNKYGQPLIYIHFIMSNKEGVQRTEEKLQLPFQSYIRLKD